VHFRFGAFLNMQDSDRGVEEIKKAVELAPDHVPALVGLTVIYLKREEIDRALEYGERAVKASPGDFSTHIALGRGFAGERESGRRGGGTGNGGQTGARQSGSPLQSGFRLFAAGPQGRCGARTGGIQASGKPGESEGYRGESYDDIVFFRLPWLVAAVLAPWPAPAQQAAAPTVKTNVDEVLLDLIVRDKKGKPVTDLKPEDITVLDNGAKQTITSFRLVSGSDALTSSGSRPPSTRCARSAWSPSPSRRWPKPTSASWRAPRPST
jgi:hypothetical protein